MADTTAGKTGMTTTAVAELIRVSTRQLDYWVRVGYITVVDARPGTGHVRAWSNAEVRDAAVFAALVHAGIRHDAILDGWSSLNHGPDWFAMYLGEVLVTGRLP